LGFHDREHDCAMRVPRVKRMLARGGARHNRGFAFHFNKKQELDACGHD
jgi:hypothetical protein